MKVKIQGKEYELNGDYSGTDESGVGNASLTLLKPLPIDIKICKDVDVLKVRIEKLKLYQYHTTYDCNMITARDDTDNIYDINLFPENGDISQITMKYDDHVFKVRTTDGQIVNVAGSEIRGILFFQDGTLRSAKIREDKILKVKFHGKDYDLPFKDGDTIVFDDNKELSQQCIVGERYNIVTTEQLKKLEKSQEQTNQEVYRLQTNQKIATWKDRWFVFGCIAISFILFSFAYLNEPMIGDPVSFVRKKPYINKYIFLFEILKRTPVIVLFLLAFKFLQLAFERIRLIGEVEKVQKYLKLAQGDNVKNNLLSIIAVPFFTHKKQKQPLLDRLVDKILINIDDQCQDHNKNNNTKNNNK